MASFSIRLGNIGFSRFFAALQTVEINHEPSNVKTYLKFINIMLPFA